MKLISFSISKRSIVHAIIVSLITLPVIQVTGFAQCKSFTKKCLPTLQPFVHNGQLNSTTLAEGETAELVMTFYSGQQYRLLLCAQDNLGKVEFQLLDQDRTMIFDNKEHNFASSWDFNVNSTMRFIISVSVPSTSSKHESAQLPGALVQSGCVALLVGFKDK